MKTRKALSVFLCIIMLFSLVPMAAFAADGTSLQFRHGFWNDELGKNEPSEERYSEMVKDYPHSGEYFFYLVDSQGNETPVNADELVFEGVVHPERYEGLDENEVRIWPDTTGEFTVSYGGYSLSGEVVLPRSGFYTQPIADVEYFIDMDREGFVVTEDNNVLYFVLTKGRVINKFEPEGEFADFVDHKISDDGTYVTLTVKTLPEDMDSWGERYSFRYSYTVSLPDESGGGGSKSVRLINGFPHIMGHYTSWKEGGVHVPSEETITKAEIQYSIGELLYFSFGNKDDYVLLGPDDVKVADSSVVELIWEGQGGACYLQTLSLGETEILYTHTDGKTYSMPLIVNLPYIGSYSEPVRSAETIIDSYRYNGSEGSFYIIPDEGRTIKNATLVDDYYAWPEGSSVTVAPDGSYAKVTLKGEFEDSAIQVPVVLEVEYSWGDTQEEQYWCSITNAKPGMLVRYQMADGDGNICPDPDYFERDIYASLGWGELFICFTDGNEEMLLTASQLTNSNGDILAVSDADHGAIRFDFLHRGDAELSYTHSDGKTYSLPVSIDYPIVGIFTENERSEEAHVVEYVMEEGDNTLYLIPEDGYEIVDVETGDLPEGTTVEITENGAIINIAPFVGEKKYFHFAASVNTPYSENVAAWDIYLPITGLEEGGCALGHSWDDGKITAEPSETEEGEKTYTCTVCGEIKIEKLPVKEHECEYMPGNVIEPTCTEEGYTVYSCTCGDSYVDDRTPALGHDWDEGEVTKEPSETEEGEKIFNCSRCDETRTEAIDKLEPGISGSYDNISWTFRDGVLTVSGEGDASGFFDGEAPWIKRGLAKDVEKAVVKEGITCIGQKYFKDLENLESVSLPATLTEIGSEAFRNCESLTEINLPDSLTTMGQSAFDGCASLKTITIPGSLKNLPDFSFFDCTALETVVFNDGTEKIGSQAFRNNASLKTIHLPASFKGINITSSSLSGHSFYACDSICDIYFAGSPSQWDKLELDADTLSRFEKAKIHFGAEDTDPDPDPDPDPKPKPEDNPFTDVAEQDFFFAPVQWAVSKGVTNGLSATSFGPKADCTRAQVVTFLWRAAGEPAPESNENPFTDISEGQYYYDAVLWAVEQGITTGLSATTFGPNAACNRAQVVTFLWRAAGKPVPRSGDNPFGDVIIGQYYYDAVLWAVENEITTGLSATSFGPGSVCNRSQIVTFLYRHFE